MEERGKVRRQDPPTLNTQKEREVMVKDKGTDTGRDVPEKPK